MTHAFIGLMVLYRPTEEQALGMNKRREDARQNREKMREERPGFQAHVGNPINWGERVPMIITQVWPNEFGPNHHGVNGQAFLDGSDSLWVTSVEEGDQPGQWEAITDR
jgi:hypothetical protein